MSGLSGAILISGVVLLDGRPAVGQRVLLLSAQMNRFVAAAQTDVDGRYSIHTPAQSERSGVLVAKIQGPVLALQHQAIPLTTSTEHNFRIDTKSDAFFAIHVEIVPAPGLPANDVEISITPTHLAGVPAPIEAFFLRREERVVDASYFETRPAGRGLDLIAQRGTYRIAASRINYRRPSATIPLPPNLIAARIEADGETAPLPGEPMGGFTLTVERNRRVRLYLEVLPDEALLR